MGQGKERGWGGSALPGGLGLRLGSLIRAHVSFYLQRQTIDHFKQP